MTYPWNENDVVDRESIVNETTVTSTLTWIDDDVVIIVRDDLDVRVDYEHPHFLMIQNAANAVLFFDLDQ